MQQLFPFHFLLEDYEYTIWASIAHLWLLICQTLDGAFMKLQRKAQWRRGNGGTKGWH